MHRTEAEGREVLPRLPRVVLFNPHPESLFHRKAEEPQVGATCERPG